MKKNLIKKNIKNTKNDNTTVKEIIKTKLETSYIYKDKEFGLKTIFASPILKDNKVLEL